MIDTKQKIKNYIETHFLMGKPLGGTAAPLFSSGVIDSFGVLELIAFLESNFGVMIDTQKHELNEFDTIDSIAALLQKLKPAPLS